MTKITFITNNDIAEGGLYLQKNGFSESKSQDQPD